MQLPPQYPSKTSMMDPITWRLELPTNDSPYLPDLKIFISEIRKLYGDNNRKPNAGSRLYLEFRQGHHDPDDRVPAYCNRL